MGKEILHKIAFVFLVSLFIFLPLSAWLISLTGNASIGFARDVFVFLIFAITLLTSNHKSKNKLIVLLAVMFLIWGGATYFWREASVSQWLRGFRFTYGPIVLFLSLLAFKINQNQKKTLIYVITIEAVLLGIVGLLEYFNIKIPMFADYNATGALNETNYIGNTGIIRLKSILAGPNALGLYLLVVLGYLFGTKKNIFLWFMTVFLIIILILTFSRSVIIGLIVLLLLSLFLYLKNKIGRTKSLIAIAITIIVMVTAGYWAYNRPKLNDFFTHADSSERRTEQYRRIWDQRLEIGWLGRGMGTAGPSSVNRLDNGPNHWTENIYLDMFEETGLIGITLYLILIISLIVKTAKVNRMETRTAFPLLAGFSIAGLFINYYTGQVGIYLFWLALGLALSDNSNYEKDLD